ncbi:MAG: alpha-amylase family glycosyl hydrolase [Verrucomicrobiota bacterium JB022]|nr:alpha-amylase family glycosyl hydrolase [Verrucomicrobiota bacterium JB022]
MMMMPAQAPSVFAPGGASVASRRNHAPTPVSTPQGIALKRHPLVYEIRASQLLQRCQQEAGNDATLADTPDALLDRWHKLGFQAIWIMGVWQRGVSSVEVSRTHPDFTCHYEEDLPGWQPEDVCGSPYAIQRGRVAAELGGADALQALRHKLAKRGIALILDFVLNHTALDHPWVESHPEYFIRGTEGDLKAEPDRFVRLGDHVFAHGRDPYFPAWKDTLQLDFRMQAVRDNALKQLQRVADLCDGVRCDLAMLAISDTFKAIWGGDYEPLPAPYEEFWAWAIDRVHQKHPRFTFMAEAYWGMEAHLQALGFDFTYRKQFYDLIVARKVEGLRGSLTDRRLAGNSVFFIENHDEPRAARAIPVSQLRRAAATMVATLPGMRLIHDGQMEALKHHHSLHLSRRADEVPDDEELAFYERLLLMLQDSSVGQGEWQLLETQAAWQGNHSHWRVQAYLWRAGDGRMDLVVANLSEHSEEGRVMVPNCGVCGRLWQLRDRLSPEVYLRSGSEMFKQGLYVRLQPYTVQIFELRLAKD